MPVINGRLEAIRALERPHGRNSRKCGQSATLAISYLANRHGGPRYYALASASRLINLDFRIVVTGLPSRGLLFAIGHRRHYYRHYYPQRAASFPRMLPEVFFRSSDSR